MRIVFDALAKANQGGPSLTIAQRLATSTKFAWNRLKPVALCGDIIKQALLQERIREADRDTFRFHWIRDKNSSQVETLRFTLAATLKQHL